MTTILIHTQQLDDNLPMSLDLHVRMTLPITAQEAQRRVKRHVIPELGTGLAALKPELSVNEGQVLWRVPILLSLPELGSLGIVGFVCVDASSGEIQMTHSDQEGIINHARWLYAGAALSAN